MTDTHKENIITKIGKLMRHEGSARHIGNVAEAEAFAAKAQELMLRYKLEMSDIEAVELAQNEPIEDEFILVHDLVKDGNLVLAKKQHWLGVMLVGLSKANFCYVLGNGGRQWGYHIIGRKSDREALKTMTQYLFQACIEVVEVEVTKYKLTNMYATESMLHTPRSLMVKFRNAFKVGFASAVAERMRTERQQLLNSVNETGLVKLDGIRAEVDEFVRKRFGKLRHTKVKQSHHYGYNAGRRYGSTVGINSNKRLVA